MYLLSQVKCYPGNITWTLAVSLSRSVLRRAFDRRIQNDSFRQLSTSTLKDSGA